MNCEFDCKSMRRHVSFITSSFYFSNPLTSTVSCRQAMIDEFDLDGDGEINEAEFFAIMTDDT